MKASYTLLGTKSKLRLVRCTQQWTESCKVINNGKLFEDVNVSALMIKLVFEVKRLIQWWNGGLNNYKARVLSHIFLWFRILIRQSSLTKTSRKYATPLTLTNKHLLTKKICKHIRYLVSECYHFDMNELNNNYIVYINDIIV